MAEDKMEGVVVDGDKTEEPSKAPEADKIILDNFELLEQAVDQFDARFTLRALRSISSIRKSPDLPKSIALAIQTALPNPSNPARQALESALPEEHRVTQNGVHAGSEQQSKMEENQLPEVWAYLAVLLQVYLYDTKQYKAGAVFSTNVVDKIRSFNRRTLDALGARAYFYYALFHEQLDPLPPSRQSPVIDTRPKLLAALRSSVIRKDQETQAAVTVLLLRNYISTADITQADLLIAQTQFPTTASNNQVCRYLYYLGRIRAIQLSYTSAHEHLESATRKSPTSNIAAGFYQQATKLLIVVELLMGDIPERALFRQPSLEIALHPYFRLVQAVRVGDLPAFLAIVEQHASQFRTDGSYTLILRLRQNVIKTGVRMLSLSYSRISLRDICLLLHLDSEESAEYIVAKAIRDGVIEASLDHEHGYMTSKQPGDVYVSREPAEAFDARIQALLGMRDECVMAMRYPMNKHRQELKSAQEARERERELAKEIQDGGDLDEDDGEGGFEGM